MLKDIESGIQIVLHLGHLGPSIGSETGNLPVCSIECSRNSIECYNGDMNERSKADQNWCQLLTPRAIWMYVIINILGALI